ncbi:MAG: right-handed parallel beta-helix repeat-containing protein [Phycisphaerae bacterium]|nr:right-handed parallel beta-helix repeat-containing protein [Phycisphaerae bacterium]
MNRSGVQRYRPTGKLERMRRMKDFFTAFLAILWGAAFCWVDEGISRPHTCLTCRESDLTSDCRINLADFAQMASGWLQTKNLSNLSAMASQWLSAVPTVGAQPPYREYEAEQANSSGILIGPNRTYLTPASEASGRQAVKLVNVGHYIEFTLLEPANAMVLRFSIPDSADGKGEQHTLSVYINGIHTCNIMLTSAYSWVYGAYPYTNNPADGSGHHFYDEAAVLLGQTLPAGTRIRLQKDSTDTAQYYRIDLADFEMVPAPLSRPADFLCLTDFGAAADDSIDDTEAMKSAVLAAQTQGKGLWIPPGRFLITARVNLENITLRGAGCWYSVLEGLGCRLYGRGGTIILSDFKIDGLSTYRTVGERTGIEGQFGPGSRIEKVWVEHTEAGIWISGPTEGLLITGCRIRNTFADGLNLAYGVSSTTAEHCSIRNTGDDGMAMWSYTEWGPGPNQNNLFRCNTIQMPLLANGIGLYGGSSNSIVGCWIRDTVVNGAGIQIANRFSSYPFAGTTTIQNNRLERTGSRSIDYELNAGALWLFPADGDMTAPVAVLSNVLADSTYQGILLGGPLSTREITASRFQALAIQTAGTYGIEINVKGSGYFEAVQVQDAQAGGLLLNNPDYQITVGPGNSGW